MWIARDKNGELMRFVAPPKKFEKEGLWIGYGGKVVKDDRFPEVKWEDLEPTELVLVAKGGTENANKPKTWVDAKGRLPEDRDRKLILLKDGSTRLACIDYDDDYYYPTAFWLDREAGNQLFNLDEVLAWMDIPNFDGFF